MAATTSLTPEVIGVLDACRCDGNALFIPGGLSNPLPPKLYRAVNYVLVALGGTWNKKLKAHLFKENPADAISDAIVAGSVENRKQVMGFFETPAPLAKRLVEMADVGKATSVLEPSAGRGAIAREIRTAARFVRLDVVELDTKHHDQLFSVGATSVLFHDFLQFNPPKELEYDCIIANPPFAKQTDIDHVTHMHRCLAPGGSLVSVMSAGVTFRKDRKTIDFIRMIESNGGTIDMLPAGSFKESGTNINTCVVRIPKPM